MKTIIENGELVIRIPLQAPTPSASGKTLLVASTYGPIHTGCEVEGKRVTVALNAYINR